MKNKVFGYLLYGLSFILIIFYIGVTLQPNTVIETNTTLLFALISCLLIYFGGVLLFKFYKNDKPLKINLWLLFILYILLFIDFTLFDTSWGRQGLFETFNWEFIKNSVNVIPFSTIYEYLIENFNNLTSTSVIFYNILGNFVALMPMSFFLTLLFKNENKFKNFFLTILLITLGIELLQLFSGVGRFDIDDIILNVAGATLMYFILKIKVVNNLIKNIFLLENHKISKKSYILIIITMLFVTSSIILLIKFRNNLYNNNFDEFNKIHNPIITIKDESKSGCDQELDLFYQDELYNYYFTCMKSDKVYAIINNKEKYLVKDFMTNETYNYSIERLLNRLDFYKVDYIKENKYQYITLKVNVPIDSNNSFSRPNIYIIIENENILNAKYDYEDNLEDATFYYKIHLIPKTLGSTTMDIVFKDNDNNLLVIYKYSIKVDKNLNVEYKESKE